MRVRTLEIRWHDSKPISTCDFQPIPFKKARPAQDKQFPAQAYRLATGGEDNHVRLWTVHPNILPPSLVEGTSETPAPRPPRVEYLATLSRHSAAVNVVRFSPNGDLIASAGDDGMIIVWAPTASPHASSYGSDLTPEDMQYEKEHWKPRTAFRCTTMQVYDLAWSPTGEYIIAGSTDNCARIFTASEGKCVHEIAEHNHYVQGVAWDPLNEYIATQSSDRSMHIYSISYKSGGALEVHAVGKNARMGHRHSRTPSTHGRPRNFRRESTASETESVITSVSERLNDEVAASPSLKEQQPPPPAMLTPTASVASTPSMTMFPPPYERPSSRRSSFSGSNAPSSPANYSRYGRSPSPMPALPAIRMAPTAAWASVRLYGDESFSNFFRRLTFSPDGGLLLTPAGQFEDPSVIPTASASSSKFSEQQTRGRKGNPSGGDARDGSSSVYIYSRANFARPPIARLPGHKKASVAVRFSPILYELRPGVWASESQEPKSVMLDPGVEVSVDVDIGIQPGSAQDKTPHPSPVKPSGSTLLSGSGGIAAPSPRIAIPTGPNAAMMPSPALSATDSMRPPTPAASKPGTPAPPMTPTATASVFALPYRMLYAVATMDTVMIYDTQQAGPVCLLTKLHYDEFTDMSWSPDGQCLMLSSRDGYCTLVVFDEILPAYHTQQHTLQLQSIAHHHALPLTNSASSTMATPLSTPSTHAVGLPTLSPITSLPMPLPTPSSSSVLGKRSAEPPLTPAASVDENVLGGGRTASEALEGPSAGSGDASGPAQGDDAKEPPRKKRRAALTRVGDLGS
ncbi:WD40 repeat-like protein [Dichomitus squalens LYAD-421 SS1]|uniref:WD40 repeat-like protein n=1 Tax=Dichomitus squalens (strain LYAD-421) TaxID=732165 RepID=R7SVT5_DICSQ|nr:WD40 repeat-like protein [Dichomitus squalens LYAD-421 SS1]EJF59880.1 WD40 repeat-like protein [Dichomitus squalens LYAD-421 SS1]